MRWVLGLLVLLAGLLPGAAAGAAESTTYQLDAAHTGAVSEPGLDRRSPATGRSTSASRRRIP